MRQRKLVLLFFLAVTLFLSSLVLTDLAKGESIKYQGDVYLRGFDREYKPGNKLKGKIEVSNSENFPLFDAYVYLQLQKGCREPIYPSQKSDCDNVFWEKRLSKINLPRKSSKKISFEKDLPDDLSPGIYRLDAYFRTERTPVVGFPHIYSSPKSVSFQVTGEGDFPKAKIIRTETRLKGTEQELGDWNPNQPNLVSTMWPWVAGPVGILVTPEMEEVKGKIKLKNNLNRRQDLKLETVVCTWEDTTCEDPKTYTKQIELGANSEEFKRISFPAPEEPNVYSVRFNLLDSDGRLTSVYRNRIIVKGRVARIRKLHVNKSYYRPWTSGKVNVLVGGSPDHYTDPKIKNTELEVKVKDVESGKSFLSYEKKIDDLSMKNFLFESNRTFEVSEETKKINVTAKVFSKGGELWDQHSILVEPTRVKDKVDDVLLTSEYKNGDLKIKLCTFDKNGYPVFSNIQAILFSDKGEHLITEPLNPQNCASFSYSSSPGKNYSLQVNAYHQYNFNLTTYGENESFEQESGEESKSPSVGKKSEDRVETEDRGWPILMVIIPGLILLALVVGYYIYKVG